MTGWQDLAQRYAAERPVYERLANHVADRARLMVAKSGILCEVSHRAKDVDSFVKKSLRVERDYGDRPKYPNPLVDIKDKAGVRVIATFADDLESVLGALTSSFDHGPIDDKRTELEFNRLGYFAIHIEVWLSEADTVGRLTEFRGRSCEVQVQTRAGNLWSEASHDLL